MNKYFAVIIFTICFFTSLLRAQLNEMRIVGAPKEEPGELVSRTMLDANSDVCAGVIIYSDLTGITFRSVNGIVKRNSKPGEDFLFVSPDERMIEVYCIGYAPLKIVLNDVGVRLKSGQTWSMKVTGDKKLDVLPINLVIEPAGASVALNGEVKGVVTSLQAPVGVHTLRVSKDGFKTYEKQITVSASSTLFNITLAEVELQTVTISSSPEGANIYLDNVDKGETNKQPFLYPNTYSLRLTKSGYLDVQEKIEVKENGKNIFSFAMVKNSGVLQLTISPSDARVLINGGDYTNKNRIELTPGKYAIRVEKSGFLSSREEIDLPLGKMISKSFSLIKNSGTLQLDVSPVGARVLINREDYTGRSPIELAPGRYKIEIDKAGYNSSAETIDIVLGKQVDKKYSLEAKTGNLQFSVTPIDAKVVLKQNNWVMQQWVGAKIVKDIQVGEYNLEVSASGFATRTIKISVVENKTMKEEIVLLKETPAIKSSSKIDIDIKWILVEDGPTGDFKISATEVTFDQFDAFCEATGYKKPSGNFGRGNQPVINVNVADAQAFCSWLSKKTGTTVRLPEENEWEYAAKGGNKSRGYEYSGSNSVDEVAWYTGNSGGKTHEVATKKSNELGIYDMSGNVWELCGTSGTVRGGSWANDVTPCRVSNRYDGNHGRYDYYGFRVLQK